MMRGMNLTRYTVSIYGNMKTVQLIYGNKNEVYATKSHLLLSPTQVFMICDHSCCWFLLYAFRNDLHII
jgi:hypothetical protein